MRRTVFAHEVGWTHTDLGGQLGDGRTVAAHDQLIEAAGLTE
jgi:hypothetical protein